MTRKVGRCKCDLCERIRELEAELASESLQLLEQQARAERAEARVKELESALQKALHARESRSSPARKE
jgi:hypothetical protein